MSAGEIFYIGAPAVCLAGMIWLFYEGARIRHPRYDAYNERMARGDRDFEQAPHSEAAQGHGCPMADELGSMCDRYMQSVN